MEGNPIGLSILFLNNTIRYTQEEIDGKTGLRWYNIT